MADRAAPVLTAQCRRRCQKASPGCASRCFGNIAPASRARLPGLWLDGERAFCGNSVDDGAAGLLKEFQPSRHATSGILFPPNRASGPLSCSPLTGGFMAPWPRSRCEPSAGRSPVPQTDEPGSQAAPESPVMWLCSWPLTIGDGVPPLGLLPQRAVSPGLTAILADPAQRPRCPTSTRGCRPTIASGSSSAGRHSDRCWCH